MTFHHPHRLRHVHPVRPHGHRQRHGRRLPEQIQRPRIRRRLHEHPVARREQQPDQQRKGLLGAGGDQDLPRPGRHAPRRVPGRDRRPQRPDPRRVVAEVPFRQHERAVRLRQLGRRPFRGGAAQQDHVVRRLQEMQEERIRRLLHPRGVQRQRGRGHPGPAALAPHQRAFPPERLVRGDHRRTAHGEGRREPPVRRQERARGQRTLVDQPAQPGGEQQVQRPAPGGPAAEPGDEVVRAGQGPGRAGQGPGRGGQGPGGGGQGSGRGGERRVDWLHRRTNLPGLDL
ncbi:hypothetical protein GCM10010299_39780 [Streptomyces tanashiensis]|nr:hypothetical protein GCM10010299_39780 [Streptomyces tanashiensis]